MEVPSVSPTIREYVGEMLDAGHAICPNLGEPQVISLLDRLRGTPIVIPFPARLAVQRQPNS